MLNDLRLAIRSLRAAPGFTLIVVLTLGLGIGANTAIFSVVHGVLLEPAPVRDIDRLVMVWQTDRASGTTREPASIPDYVDARRDARHGTRSVAKGPRTGQRSAGSTMHCCSASRGCRQ
jgi:putative ABC transport system permease protein